MNATRTSMTRGSGPASAGDSPTTGSGRRSGAAKSRRACLTSIPTSSATLTPTTPEGRGSEGDLVRITGWKDRRMLDRYGASVDSERAREAHDQFSPRKRL